MLKLKFRFSPNHKDSFKPAGIIDSIFIDLTSRCNLNCRYCFNEDSIKASEHDLPLSLIKKMLSEENISHIPNWILSGGEPLLYPELDEVLNLFSQKNIRSKIATNGILFTPDVADKWVELGVASTQISIDTLDDEKFFDLSGRSPELMHKVLSNLSYAVKIPLRVVVASVLTKINTNDILKLMLYMYNIGVDSYTVYLFTPGSNLASMQNYTTDFYELPGIIDKLIEQYFGICDTRIIDTNIFPILKTPMYEKWNSKLDLRMHGCNAGQHSLSIKTNGKVSPCICQNTKEFICGDISKAGIGEIWNSPELAEYRNFCFKIPECKDCEHFSNCRAGCRSNAFLFGKKGLDSFDPMCESFSRCNPSSAVINL